MNSINYLGILLVVIPFLLLFIKLGMFDSLEDIKLTISSFFMAIIIMAYLWLMLFFLAYK